MQASRRKVILINPKFQISIIFHFVALALVCIGIFYAANAWFFHRFTEMGHQMGLAPEHVFFQFIDAQKSQMNWLYLLVSVIVVSMLSIGGAILSHKVAGPIYRLCKHLKGIQDGGEISPLAFRNNDYFNEIVENVNPILDRIESQKTKNSKAG